MAETFPDFLNTTELDRGRTPSNKETIAEDNVVHPVAKGVSPIEATNGTLFKEENAFLRSIIMQGASESVDDPYSGESCDNMRMIDLGAQKGCEFFENPANSGMANNVRTEPSVRDSLDPMANLDPLLNGHIVNHERLVKEVQGERRHSHPSDPRRQAAFYLVKQNSGIELTEEESQILHEAMNSDRLQLLAESKLIVQHTSAQSAAEIAFILAHEDDYETLSKFAKERENYVDTLRGSSYVEGAIAQYLNCDSRRDPKTLTRLLICQRLNNFSKPMCDQLLREYQSTTGSDLKAKLEEHGISDRLEGFENRLDEIRTTIEESVQNFEDQKFNARAYGNGIGAVGGLILGSPGYKVHAAILGAGVGFEATQGVQRMRSDDVYAELESQLVGLSKEQIDQIFGKEGTQRATKLIEEVRAEFTGDELKSRIVPGHPDTIDRDDAWFQEAAGDIRASLDDLSSDATQEDRLAVADKISSHFTGLSGDEAERLITGVKQADQDYLSSQVQTSPDGTVIPPSRTARTLAQMMEERLAIKRSDAEAAVYEYATGFQAKDSAKNMLEVLRRQDGFKKDGPLSTSNSAEVDKIFVEFSRGLTRSQTEALLMEYETLLREERVSGLRGKMLSSVDAHDENKFELYLLGTELYLWQSSDQLESQLRWVVDKQIADIHAFSKSPRVEVESRYKAPYDTFSGAQQYLFNAQSTQQFRSKIQNVPGKSIQATLGVYERLYKDADLADLSRRIGADDARALKLAAEHRINPWVLATQMVKAHNDAGGGAAGTQGARKVLSDTGYATNSPEYRLIREVSFSIYGQPVAPFFR